MTSAQIVRLGSQIPVGHSILHHQLESASIDSNHVDSTGCWCHPAIEDGYFRVAVKGMHLGACSGRRHVAVRWSDDGSTLYVCDRCGAELRWKELA